jgi:hypothetical protein
LYKVDYYTLAKNKEGKIGNIEQFRNTYYTEHRLELIQPELERVLNIMYGSEKFHPVLTNIELIKGHGER